MFPVWLMSVLMVRRDFYGYLIAANGSPWSPRHFLSNIFYAAMLLVRMDGSQSTKHTTSPWNTSKHSVMPQTAE